MGKTKKIDFSAKRLSAMAEKYLSEGKFVPALRFTYNEIDRYGGEQDLYIRLADIYDRMGLSSSAINWWFKIWDDADAQDMPDIYEGLAANYMSMGKDAQAAFYYNCLIESDDQVPEEMKQEIAEAFSERPRQLFKISYPPRLADYKAEIDLAARALKKGDCKRAIAALDKVAEGSKDYVVATEMRALALLLAGKIGESKTECLKVLEIDPDNVRALATLAAAYLENDEKDKSLEIALKLCKLPPADAEEGYKIATVCCENGLHLEAYERFNALEKETPFDGKLLYFKGVAAFNCGQYEEALNAFGELCSIYPDAAVVEYFIKEIRGYCDALEKGEEREKPEITYFYQIPQSERERRCKFLMDIGKEPKAEAEILGIFAHTGGLFRWCFDELDGMDHDLQYLACVIADYCRVDEFLRDVLLDSEVLDLLKLEILRILYERNEEGIYGVVLYHVYRKIRLLPIKIGRKSRKKFISAYARTASKFVAINSEYGKKLKDAAEALYHALEKFDCFDQAKNADDCACAIYLLANLRDAGNNVETAALAFDANVDQVKVLLATALSAAEGL